MGCNVISSLSGDGKDILYVGTDGNGVHFVSVKENKVMKSFRYEPVLMAESALTQSIHCWWTGKD